MISKTVLSLEKSGRGSVIPLGGILKKGGIDFESAKHTS